MICLIVIIIIIYISRQSATIYVLKFRPFFSDQLYNTTYYYYSIMGKRTDDRDVHLIMSAGIAENQIQDALHPYIIIIW